MAQDLKIAKEYRKRADELRKRVAKMSDVDMRVMLTQMASDFDALAESAEANDQTLESRGERG
jgi:signal transduction histidine kinase